MNKASKLIIYIIPAVVFLGGFFVINVMNVDKGGGKESPKALTLDYERLAELASKRPQGENYLNFIRENEKMLFDRDPANDADAYITMGFNLRTLGDDVSAIKAYEEGLKLEPDNSFGLNNIATSYAAVGEFAKAEEIYRKLTKRLSGDSAAYIDFAELYKSQHPQDEGGFLDIINEGIAVSGGNHLADLLSYLGAYYRDGGNIAKSIEYFEKLVKLFPKEDIYKAELKELKKKL